MVPPLAKLFHIYYISFQVMCCPVRCAPHHPLQDPIEYPLVAIGMIAILALQCISIISFSVWTLF